MIITHNGTILTNGGVVLNNITTSSPFKMTIDTTLFVPPVGEGGGGPPPLKKMTIPLHPGVVNMTVNWGDGTTDIITTYNQAELEHTYLADGIYQITLDGSFHSIYFNDSSNTYPHSAKVLSIDQWGGNEWQTLSRAFSGCLNMVGSYTDTPNTSNAIEMDETFHSCALFNGLVEFDMSSVTTIFRMFQGCTNFNQPINFTAPNLTYIQQTFSGCINFNQPVNITSGANTSLYQTFYKCNNFNNSITLSNTSSVTTMGAMFYQCTNFNQPVTFDTTSVEDMSNMFYQCTNFTSLVTFNDTSQVKVFDNMFRQCTNFDQDISSWSILSLNGFSQSANFMLYLTSFSTTNYDSLLVAWDNYGTSGSYLRGTPAQYSAGAPATARANMVSRGWNITDGGQLP